MGTSKSGLNLKTFSKKYKEYLERAYTCRVNCLEGAYRAGKSLLNIVSFATYLDQCEDKLHLATGATSTTARLNISECNGFGLRYLFRGRCKTGKYEGHECLKIQSKRGEKIVIFVGGGLSDSYKKIQGLSFGSWISVELTNLYVSKDEKCFISMALSRLTQSKLPRIWWDLNPTYPSHLVYTKFLDVYQKQQHDGEFPGGYNYMQCSLFDNTSLTKYQKETALASYRDENSVDYKRCILGLRSYSAGIIFTLFVQNKDKWVVKDLKAALQNRRVDFVSVGIDFGGNGSDTAFVASLICRGMREVIVLRSSKLVMKGGTKDVQDFKNACKAFLTDVKLLAASLKTGVRYIFGDDADTVMLNEVRHVASSVGLGSSTVSGSVKHTIIKRINAKKVLISENRWLVCNEAESVISSTESQVWDSRPGHEDERLDNGTVDIDTADAEEYSWSGFLGHLIK